MSELVGLKKAGTQELEDSTETGSVAPVAAVAVAVTDSATNVKGGLSLVAKWKGKTIELPALPPSTTIGQVKVCVKGMQCNLTYKRCVQGGSR